MSLKIEVRPGLAAGGASKNGVYMVFLKASGIVASILAILALVIYLLKTIISLIAFLTGALKILVVLVFVAVIVGIGFMILKSWNEARRRRD